MRTTDRARIGPNSIIQTVQSLRDQYGLAQANALLAQGGQASLIEHLPAEMVDEAEFHALVQMLVAQLGPTEAAQVLYEAGQRTARYLLQHRIPRLFQHLVRLLPRRSALWLLLRAISFNAWTFVGSGRFDFVVHRHPSISVRVNYPTVSSVASFYGGTFAHLIQVLIDPRTTMQTSTSYSAGGIDCTYTLTFHQSETV